MLVISALGTDTPTIKGCEPQGGIEVLPAIFSRVVLANFSITGKLDWLFQGPRGGNLQFMKEKKKIPPPRNKSSIIFLGKRASSPCAARVGAGDELDADRIQRPVV